MGDGAELVLAAAHREHDEPVAPRSSERLDDVLLAGEVTLRAGDEHEVSVSIARMLDAAGELAEERIGEVGGDQAEGEARRVTRPRASRLGR